MAHRQARSLRTARRLECVARETPERLRPLLLDLAVEWTFDTSCSLVDEGPSTLFDAAGGPASSRTWVAANAYFLGLACSEEPCAPWSEMLFHGLCNRLVVTSTHRVPNSRAGRSRDLDPRLASTSLTRARSHAAVGPSSPLAPKHLCRCLRPRVMWPCAWSHQLSPPSPPLRVDPAGSMTPCLLVRLGNEPVELSS